MLTRRRNCTNTAASANSSLLLHEVVPARHAPAAAANTMLDSEIALGLTRRAISQDDNR
jgi:hypothetical protein